MKVDFTDKEMIAYKELLIEKKKEKPFWKKIISTEMFIGK